MCGKSRLFYIFSEHYSTNSSGLLFIINFATPSPNFLQIYLFYSLKSKKLSEFMKLILSDLFLVCFHLTYCANFSINFHLTLP